MLLKILSPILVMLLSACAAAGTSPAPLPVIDVHRHAEWPGADDAAALADELSGMDAANIVLAVLHINEPSDLETWVHAAPGRFIAGPMFPCAPFNRDGSKDCFRAEGGWPDLAWLEAGLASGDLSLLGEMLFVYYGLAPTDPRMAPYWALAARFDVPVAVHIGRGPPPGAPPRYEGCCPNFNPDLGNPAHLRPILEQYPSLRVYLQHAGLPAVPALDNIDYWDETLALLRDFPNVYVDMSIVNSLIDEEGHRESLRRFIDAGFADRIMFASDSMPAAPIIARLDAIDFLTQRQRRAILYDNAARFFRLDAATIARHHNR